MKKVLDDFGFSSLGITTEELKQTGQIIQLGVEPHRINLINQIKGVEFENAWKKKVIITIDGLDVKLISIEDLIQNKLATARPQDLADAELLKKINQPAI